MGSSPKIPSKCKKCQNKRHSKQLNTIFCKIHFEFTLPCKDFVLEKRRASFQTMCSIVMKNRKRNNGWSDWERKVQKGVLEPAGLKLGIDYKHNFKIQNEEQTGYFEIDFFCFRIGGIIEADGSAWHSEMGNGIEKDARRDQWFLKMGIKTFRVRKPEDFSEARKFLRELSLPKSEFLHLSKKQRK